MSSDEPCPGPLVWFEVPASDVGVEGAVLECAACPYVIATGSFNDAAHAHTPLLREGLSA